MRYLIIFASLFALSACQSMAPHTDKTAVPRTDLASFTEEHQRLIAGNLVNALSQLDDLYPTITTLQTSGDLTPFGNILVNEIAKTGYGLQVVEGDLGANLIRFRAASSESELGYRTLYRVEIGDQYVEREFAVTNGQVQPTSPMRVSGSNNEILLNDTSFGLNNDIAEHSYVIAKSEAVPQIKIINASVSPVSNAQLNEAMPAQDNFTGRRNTLNIYGNKPGNYENLFDGDDGVTKEVLIFANDSVRLGKENKQAVKSLAESFKPESDVFLVLGCSQGITKREEGNQYLAVGRANRVIEELVANGVDADKIFDEGCWGGNHEEKDLPTRGVVITKKRRSTS